MRFCFISANLPSFHWLSVAIKHNDSAPSLLPALTGSRHYYELIRPVCLPSSGLAGLLLVPPCTPGRSVPLFHCKACLRVPRSLHRLPHSQYQLTPAMLCPGDSRTSPVLTESDEYRCFINRSLAFGSSNPYLMSLPSPFPSRSAPANEHQKVVCRLWLTTPAVGQLPSLQQHVKEQLSLWATYLYFKAHT